MLSNGEMADIRAARENIVIVPDSIYTFDKGYYDLNWFQHISDSDAFFVTRIKDNAKIEFIGQHRESNKKLGSCVMKSFGSRGINPLRNIRENCGSLNFSMK